MIGRLCEGATGSTESIGMEGQAICWWYRCVKQRDLEVMRVRKAIDPNIPRNPLFSTYLKCFTLMRMRE